MLKALEHQINKQKERLDKLYDALESGQLEIGDLAPRIKDVKSKIDGLENKQDELKENLGQEEIQLADDEVIKSYVSDLRELLSQGTIIEQRAFIKTFVNRVDYEHPNITVEYTIPFDTKKAEPPGNGVLPIALYGSSGRT